jgi:hypothetical protein
MILAKDKQGELCLIGNQRIKWYHDYEIIKVLKDLPIQLRRFKCSDKLKDILLNQLELYEKAQAEVKLRKELLNILYELQRKGGKKKRYEDRFATKSAAEKAAREFKERKEKYGGDVYSNIRIKKVPKK